MLPNLQLDRLTFDPAPMAALSKPVFVALAGSWIALLFHELGHAVAALLVGVRIWGIRLGVGPTIWRGRIGDCRVHLALLPFLGAVHLLDEDACAIGYRDIMAGPLALRVGAGGLARPGHLGGRRTEQSGGVVAARRLVGVLGQPSLRTMVRRSAAGRHGGEPRAATSIFSRAFRSDGIHLLAHIRAARFRLQPADAGA